MSAKQFIISYHGEFTLIKIGNSMRKPPSAGRARSKSQTSERGRKPAKEKKGKDKREGSRPKKEGEGKAPKASFRYCFSFYKGKCEKGNDCEFDHISKEEVDRRVKEERQKAKEDKKEKKKKKESAAVAAEEDSE